MRNVDRDYLPTPNSTFGSCQLKSTVLDILVAGTTLYVKHCSPFLHSRIHLQRDKKHAIRNFIILVHHRPGARIYHRPAAFMRVDLFLSDLLLLPARLNYTPTTGSSPSTFSTTGRSMNLVVLQSDTLDHSTVVQGTQLFLYLHLTARPFCRMLNLSFNGSL